MDYNDFKNPEFKKRYMNMCNSVFNKNGKKLGIYKFHKKYGNWGIIDENNNWCWRNTINTHPKVATTLYDLYKEFNQVDIDVKNEFDKFWKFVDENFELFFTKNIDSKYYKIFSLLTNKSWSIGQITTISVFYLHKTLFPNSKNFTFNLERGDPDDFKGIDGYLIYDESNKSKLQIKSGKLITKGSYYVVKGAINNFKSNCDYYVYVDVNFDEKMTSVWVFSYDINKMLIGGDQIAIESDLLLNKTFMNLPVPQLLMELLEISAKNKMIFNLSIDNTNNHYTINDDEVNIFISDFDDKELPKQLTELLEELKNRTQ